MSSRRPAPRTSLRYQVIRGLIAAPIAIGVVALLVPDHLFSRAKRPAAGSDSPDRAPAPSSPPAGPVRDADPTPATAHPAPPPARSGPSERPLPEETSPERIAAITTSAQAAAVHRILTRELLTRLEALAASHDQSRIRVAAQELAERFYLLARVVELRKLAPLGAASLDESDHARIDSLLTTWQENPELSTAVDRLFQQRDLLTDEHVPQMLRRWAETTP